MDPYRHRNDKMAPKKSMTGRTKVFRCLFSADFRSEERASGPQARFFPRNSGRKKAPKKGRIIACLISLTVFFRLVYSMANNSFANVAEFLWTGRREPAHN